MDFDFPKTEEKILKFWQKKKVFEALVKKNQGQNLWSFLDGPITANNPMGVHHAWGRTYKDLFQRYKAMQGFEQRFQNGFDCQGLWVEVEVEKEMGFKTKKDIERFGIEKFVELCKERALKFSKIQTEQSIRLGQWMDWKNSYYTMSDENNYAIWGFLKKCQDRNCIYKGRDVVPWCWRCGTAISQHEILTEEYQEIVHKSFFVKFPALAEKNTFFLVWTTTPWTLPANVALALHPDLTYAKILAQNGEIFILLNSKKKLIKEGKIIKEFLGRELTGSEYQGIFSELPEVKNVMAGKNHRVVLWKDVSAKEGTGIVHIAPGCGQEDFHLSKELLLPVVNPTTEESRYKKNFGFLADKFVLEVQDLISDNLNKKNFLFKTEDYKHRYPVCWRCKQELIFRLVDEWYISMEQLRGPLIEAAKKINWLPGFGREREIDWLKNMQDWLISKKRYWGLALPIYECKKCGFFEVIGSKEELKERAVWGWEKFEGHSPHRPWIDEVKIKCKKCGLPASRILDVGNPWLDAGIVPFSTLGYYQNKKEWQKWFPADFICESFPGQFKNWFYSLLVMSAVIENSIPAKTIFGHASLRDEKGEEMHKSKGNAVWFDEAVKIIGADPMRWMYSRQNPAFNLKFSYKSAAQIKRKLLNLYNSFVFFETYVKEKDIAPNFSKAPANILDKWIISKLQNLVEKTTKNLDRYSAAGASLAIENFFIQDLSLWYIRRSRKRFRSESKDKKEAARTLWQVLLTITELLAPFLPFFSQAMYDKIKTAKMPESVHLLDWPEAEKDKIDKALEEKMQEARRIVEMALSQRAGKGIKTRQPLAKLRIKSKLLPKDKNLLELVKEEVNVKEVVFDKKLKADVFLETKISKALREEGILREALRNVQDMRKQAGLKPGDKIFLYWAGPDSFGKILSSRKKIFLTEIFAKDIKPLKEQDREIKTQKKIKIGSSGISLAIKKI